MPHQFLSCDWGTSSLRIRWVSGEAVMRTHQEDTGCRAMFERAPQPQDRARAYEEFLRSVLLSRWGEAPEAGRLSNLFAPPPKIPLVISGMASSSIGWHELPYARTPLALDASNLGFKRIEWDKPAWISDTYLLSGVATEEEIMRGEETEAIGLLSQVSAPKNCILILPGTHSKHLFICNNRIEAFRTYMSGELFDVLSRHSILKATVDLSNFELPCWKPFEAGVERAAKLGLSASLFQTRTRAILHQCPPAENIWFLSGLLIGAELADAAKEFKSTRTLLGGTARLRSLYARAFNVLKVSNVEEINDTAVELAVPTAHALFLDHICKA